MNQVKEIFAEALERHGADRAAYLDQACADHPELRAEVEAFLAAAAHTEAFRETAAPTLSERPGAVVGRYKLLEQIGEGGFGVVFMAEQEHPVRRRVALKIIKLGMDTKQVVARFEAERQALAMMDHPGIAKVFDGGATETGRPYFVMELVRGTPITTYCDQQKLNIAQRLELFAQVCQAVQHAHQKGLIHRDIKPSNVMVSTQDDRPVIKVIDFGIAKATQARLTEKTLFTEFRQMVGTPEYMSPEQAEGGLDIDTRSDIYSLGVLLYELLAGAPPFDPKELRSKAYAEMQRIIREVEPPAPSTRLSTMKDALPTVAAQRGVEPRKLQTLVRGELDWIVMKALEKDRTRRYETANALAMDVLRHLHDEAVQACPPSAGYRGRKFIHRHRAELVVVDVVIFLIISGAVASGIGFFRAGRAERVARQQRDLASSERDRAVRAEGDARKQEQKAEAEARRAELQFADSLINQGDALVSAAEFPAAYARYADASTQLKRLSSPLARLDLSLVRLYRASPPPLWSVNLPSGYADGFVVLPSRREIIAASGDHKFHVYDLLTGAELRSFASPPDIRRLAVAASPDGPVIIAMGAISVRAIDLSSDAVLRQVEDDRAENFCVISPDGLLAASGNLTGAVTFWETASFKKLGVVQHGSDVLSGAFSHDGATVATVSNENTIALWDPKSAREIRRFPESPGRGGAGMARLTFAANDRALLCGEGAGAINLISLDGKSLATWPAHRGNVNAFRSLTVTPEGNRVISAGEDGRIRVFDNSSSGAWDPTLTMATDDSMMSGAVYVADAGPKPCAATCGLSAADQGVAIALTTHAELFAFPLVAPTRSKERLEDGISMSSDGLLCAGDALGRVELRDTATGRTLRLLPQTRRARATAFSPDGGCLYVGTDEGTLQCFDDVPAAYAWSVHAHEQPICSIAVSPDGAVVASAGEDGSVRVWDARTGALLCAMHCAGGFGTAAVFAPESESPAGRVAGTQPSLRGRRLIFGGGNNGVVYQWDLAGDQQLARAYASGMLRGLTLSPDRKLLAVPTVAHRASLLDSATLAPIGTLGPVGSILYQVQFIDPGSGPGTWALSCGNRELRAWDVSSGQERLVLDAGSVYGVSNAPNYSTNTLVTSGDGTLVIAKGTGRINLALPRRYRDLLRAPSPVARAEWYAAWGLWAWTRELLQREQAGGHEVPALLLARAHWMCGDYEAARRAFDLAVARHEAPAGYAASCLSVGDTPPTVAPRPPVARPPDPGGRAPTTAPLPEGVLAAVEVPALKALIGKEVAVEGIVTDSVWSRSGKVMNIQFAGAEQGQLGLFCCIFQKDRERFDAAFGGDAAKVFSGARLRVRGTPAVYGGYDQTLKGWPQIILGDPEQVTIVENRPAHGELAVPLSAAGMRAQEAEICFKRATAHLDAQRYAEAAADFAKVIELQPQRSDAWTGLGFSHFHRQQWDQAIADFSKAIELDPHVHTNWYHRGHAYINLAQWDKAAADLTKAIEVAPDHAWSWFVRAQIYAQMQRPEEAVADLRQAVAHGVTDVARMRTDAWLEPLRANDEFKKLMADLEIRFRPARDTIEGALDQRNTGQLDEAIQVCSDILSREPDNDAAWLERGNCYLRKSAFAKAIEDFTQVIRLKPDNGWAWHERGYCYWMLGQHAKAIADHSRSIELGDQDAGQRLRRGHSYRALGQLQKAEEDYSRAIELNPGDWEGWYARARLDHQQHKVEKARSDLASLIKLPLDPRAQNEIAWSLATDPDESWRNPALAVELAEKATAVRPKDGNLWNTLGAARYRNGQWKEAIAAFDKSMQLHNGGDCSDWFFLAMCHWQLGDKQVARKWYDQAALWMDKNQPRNAEFRRFRAEAAELLRIPLPSPASAPATRP